MAKAPTSRPKRVSLKGKGADIFFGDYAPADQTMEQLPPGQTDTPGSIETASVLAATGERPSPEASVPPDQGTGEPSAEATEARKQEHKLAGTLAPLRASKTGRRKVSDDDRPEAQAVAGTRTAQHVVGPSAVTEMADVPAMPEAERTFQRTEPSARGQLLDEIAPAVWEHLDIQATITNAFRYTDEELSALADVLYQISKAQKARVTKQDVARLGLNVVLDDYRRRGADSLLGQLASRRKSPRRSGGG